MSRFVQGRALAKNGGESAIAWNNQLWEFSVKQALLTLMISWLVWPGTIGRTDERFIYPKEPVETRNAPSEKVENGTTYECGFLKVLPNETLVLPESAVVEEHDGSLVQFYLTKSVQFSGQPPHPMQIAKWRTYLGIAKQKENDAVAISTYGEWSNKGGSANIRLLVRVPQGQAVEQRSERSGADSAASKPMDFNDPGMQECYWYSGIGAKENWEPIETGLNYNRFLEPQ
jgi:hypothetical protein